MAIVKYERVAARYERKVFEHPKVSQKNKALLRRFLFTYDVSPARRHIFLEKNLPLLIRFPDLEETLTDRDGMNHYFAKLRARYAPATFSMYVNVAGRLLTWINDGERPSCLKDIRRQGRSRQKRDLDANELLTWDDVLKMAAFADSIQLRAIIAVQFDAGFRPSEFHELDFGDVRELGGLFVVHVRRGKTGQREVVLYRSTEFMRDWLRCHPTRQPRDPLWIGEAAMTRIPPSIARYRYEPIRKRVRATAKRAGISKPIDFYAIRHASCAADKRDNLPLDIGASRHGHSVKHFTETYGALDTVAMVERVLRHYHGAQSPTPHSEPSMSATPRPMPEALGRQHSPTRSDPTVVASPAPQSVPSARTESTPAQCSGNFSFSGSFDNLSGDSSQSLR